MITEKTINKLSPELLQSENFVPHPAIENQLKINYRSKAWKMEVLLPADSSIYIMNEIINFKTKGLIRSTYHIEIYNNKLALAS